MAGRGPAPADQRRRANAPDRGDWQSAPATGWQHGDIPACPVRSRAAQAAWATWMGAWFSAHWTPDDLPNLRLVIRLWSKCDTGKATSNERTELRQLMDSYGITPKGQQDRRWTRPKDAPTAEQHPDGVPSTVPSRYAHLRTVAS